MKFQELLENIKKSDTPFIYIESLENGEQQYTDDLIVELRKATQNRDMDLTQVLLALAEQDGINKSYAGILTELVNQNWHHCNEDIVEILGEIGDPSAIDPIYNAALYIPDYDEGRGMAKKCIRALRDINTVEAKEKIGLLAKHPDKIISEYASYILSR